MACIGLDIGGTKTAAILTDSAGRTIAEAAQPTDARGPEALLAGTVDLVDRLLARAGETRDAIEAVGAGVPGLVDPQAGTVELAVNLNIMAPYPFAAALSAEIGAPVALENDVRAAALGVYQWANESRPTRSIAYLSIGTGIAAGIVVDGAIYRGAHGMAGEIGHLPVELGGPRCNCGATGCLEAIASGPAIAAAVSRTMGSDGRGPVGTEEAFELAAAGDAGAVAAVSRASAYLARTIYLLVMTHDVERVVVGGGVTQAGDLFWQPLARSLAELRRGSPLAETMLSPEKIDLLPATFGAGVRGAVLLPVRAAAG